MMNLELSNEEIDMLLQSARHCLNSCHDGGLENNCPDCRKLEDIILKMQKAVSQQ